MPIPYDKDFSKNFPARHVDLGSIRPCSYRVARLSGHRYMSHMVRTSAGRRFRRYALRALLLVDVSRIASCVRVLTVKKCRIKPSCRIGALMMPFGLLLLGVLKPLSSKGFLSCFQVGSVGSLRQHDRARGFHRREALLCHRARFGLGLIERTAKRPGGVYPTYAISGTIASVLHHSWV